jgi:ketosteroid isomerase-like protein
MKRMIFAVGMVVLVFAVGILAQTGEKPQSGNAEQELIKLENEWNVAIVKADLAFLDRIMVEDFTYTDPDGVVWTKAQILTNMKSGEDATSSMAGYDWKVRVYGDAAVVTARYTTKETLKGKNISGRFRGTDTWIKKDGRWRCVATHSSRIVGK